MAAQVCLRNSPSPRVELARLRDSGDRADTNVIQYTSGAPVEAVAFYFDPCRCTMKLFIGLCVDEHVSLGAVFSHSG